MPDRGRYRWTTTGSGHGGQAAGAPAAIVEPTLQSAERFDCVHRLVLVGGLGAQMQIRRLAVFGSLVRFCEGSKGYTAGGFAGNHYLRAHQISQLPIIHHCPLDYSVPRSVAFGTSPGSNSMRKRMASACGGSPPIISPGPTRAGLRPRSSWMPRLLEEFYSGHAEASHCRQIFNEAGVLCGGERSGAWKVGQVGRPGAVLSARRTSAIERRPTSESTKSPVHRLCTHEECYSLPH